MRLGNPLDVPTDIEADLAAIDRIQAVPTILEVVCRTTGMGFAAVGTAGLPVRCVMTSNSVSSPAAS
jgi:hypothetical protein